MEPSLEEQRHQAHILLNAVPDETIPKIRSLLASIVDPLAVALANAPLDEEPLTEEEEQALAEARESFTGSEDIPHEQILKEFGLTWEDWDRMGQTPLDAAGPSTTK
jgi:hypothetical protein